MSNLKDALEKAGLEESPESKKKRNTFKKFYKKKKDESKKYDNKDHEPVK
jgi:hypothetical protein